MKLLLVKTSSLGDIIHTFPALTEALQKNTSLQVDWVVEEAFVELAAMHSGVNQIIPVAMRRWRRHPLRAIFSGEWSNFLRHLRRKRYDLVLDAQGLVKSSYIARSARAGSVHGLNWSSAREPLASLFYHQRYSVDVNSHAIVRVRQLFAKVFGYEPSTPLSNLSGAGTFHGETCDVRSESAVAKQNRGKVLLLHGTTWRTKQWPVKHWQSLAKELSESGFSICTTWGSKKEQEVANLIQAAVPEVEVWSKQPLPSLVESFRSLCAVVSVDTGLAHLAAAMNIPCVSIYGPTDPSYTGTLGKSQRHEQGQLSCVPCKQEQCMRLRQTRVRSGDSPCMQETKPEQVTAALLDLLGSEEAQCG